MKVEVKTTQGDPVTYRLVSVPQYLLWNVAEISAITATMVAEPSSPRK